MNVITALKVSNVFLVIAVMAIVSLLVLFYISQKEIAKQQAIIMLQQKEIKKLQDTTSKKINVGALVKNMLDNMTFTQAVASVGSYGEEYTEAITAELWKQYHERCARESVCTKK